MTHFVLLLCSQDFYSLVKWCKEGAQCYDQNTIRAVFSKSVVDRRQYIRIHGVPTPPIFGLRAGEGKGGKEGVHSLICIWLTPLVLSAEIKYPNMKIAISV